jgi:formate hydrogenlyase subunit 3/multisubunit Na+/H+ antiporter MnhD subunit
MKKKIFKSLIAIFVSVMCFAPLLATPVLADQFGQNYAGNTNLGNNDPRDIMVSILNLAMTFLAIIAVIVILIGGFKWMTAAGNEDKVEEAKKLIAAGVIGLVITLSAFMLVTWVVNTTNTDILDV